MNGYLEATQAAAVSLDLHLEIYMVATEAEVDAAIDRIRTAPVDALALNPDFMVFSRLAHIVEMAREKKIPTIGIDPSQVKQGILLSYGGGLKDIARQAARQVDLVLKGTSPAEISIEPPREYKLYVNITTAEQIGIKVPEEILFQANGYFR